MSEDVCNRKRAQSYRPWGSTEDGSIEFESLTTETLDGALGVLRESFFPLENVCIGGGILLEPGAAEELEKLCLETAKDGVSVVAVEVETKEVVGVAFNKLHKRPAPGEKGFFEEFAESCQHQASKFLVKFMMEIDDKFDLFRHYNVDGILEVMFLATSPRHQRKRIGELLISSSLELGRQLLQGKPVKTEVDVDGSAMTNADAIPSLASAIMTSNFSQKIAQKLGFEALTEVRFDQIDVDGGKMADRIGNVHKTARLVAKRL